MTNIQRIKKEWRREKWSKAWRFVKDDLLTFLAFIALMFLVVILTVALS